MKQLSLTEARAKLSSLVADVDRGKGPVAIAQRSKVKAVLVDPEWHSRVEEELAHYRRTSETVLAQAPRQYEACWKPGPGTRRITTRTGAVSRTTCLPASSDLRYRHTSSHFLGD